MGSMTDLAKENYEPLYNYCFYMLQNSKVVQEVLVAVLREFGDYTRRFAPKEPEIRLRLFQLARQTMREAPFSTSQLPVGRDTRSLKGLDDDLLAQWTVASSKEKGLKEIEAPLLERLARLDTDLRAPVILKDILKLEDEEVARILGIRWGVYRHRLHRGRIEFLDNVCGRNSPTKPKAQLGKMTW